MAHTLLRKIASLDLEEKILNAGVILTIVSMFFPWFGGRWIADEVRMYNGFGFYTSFIGLTVFALNVYILMTTITPLTSKVQLVRKEYKDIVRLCCAIASTVLILSALSVLIKVTFEYQAMQMRFGVGSALFGSLASMFYAFIQVQSSKRQEVFTLFHQDDSVVEDIEQIAHEAKEDLLSKSVKPIPEPKEQPVAHAVHPAPPPPPPPESHSSRYL